MSMFNVVIFNKCNLSCNYCFAETYMTETAEQFDSNTMELSVFEDIVDFAKKSGLSYLSLLGGEPTLHPKFDEFINTSYAKGVGISIKTNALFIKSASQLFGAHTDKNLHFLINLNHPDSMGESKWQKTCENLKELSKMGFKVDFQLNIDSKEFDYQYLWDVMKDFPKAILYWTFTVPIYNPKSNNTYIDPFKAKKEIMPRVLQFLEVAKSKAHRTFGTHGITPCLFPEGYFEENPEHQLGSNCVPVFDFYPDHSIHYCFPLEGYNSINDFRRFDNLQQVQSEFLWKASCTRPLLFPWKQCIGCEFAADGTCHGGCMSNKPWLQETFDQLNGEIDIFDFTPSLTKPIESVIKTFPQFGWSKKMKKDLFKIHPEIYNDFLNEVDGTQRLSEIKLKLEKKYKLDLQEWINVVLYNLFGTLDLVLLAAEHKRMQIHEG